MLSTALCCVGFSGLFKDILNQELFFIFFHISIIKLIILAIMILALVFTLRNFYRARKTGKKRYFVFFLLAAAVVYFSSQFYGALSCMIIAGLYCAAYVERFMLAYVDGKKAPVPDFVFPAALIVVYFANVGSAHAAVYIAGIVYQLVFIVVIFLYGFIPLRGGWVWINPQKPSL
jgi:hypothetical protein